eukprot:TRINITY_DN19591_c0_g1_i2.p1 TRINITY_DN19591_c0_g1~~TRINITY_DN19591_c0_g1_i2.p1  ORF type:complete len:478 (+),score=59.95 TRINITY_DN19591_c0_g1_i2:2-1435(+)
MALAISSFAMSDLIRNASGEFVARVWPIAEARNYSVVLKMCEDWLQRNPHDSSVRELQSHVSEFVAAGNLDAQCYHAEPPAFSELQVRSSKAAPHAFEALFAALQNEEVLWSMGEQAVGIFADAWQLASDGALRDRLHGMSCVLVGRLVDRSRSSRWFCGSVDFELPAHCTFDHWFFEALGLLWWQAELGLGLDSELHGSARAEWYRRASTGDLFSFRVNDLPLATASSLFTSLMEVWMVERCVVCQLFDDACMSVPFGVAEVFAEVKRRPLPEPRSHDHYDIIYLLTHVVFVLNSYGGCLPNCRSDCPWLYDYLWRCLEFWLREGRCMAAGDYFSLHMDPSRLGEDAVDIVGELVDILRELPSDCECEGREKLLREALDFLLRQQGERGLFVPPGGASSDADTDEYDRLHPTWAAATALQLDRRRGCSSARSEAWTTHARRAAKSVGFEEPPPSAAAAPMISARSLNLVDMLSQVN